MVLVAYDISRNRHRNNFIRVLRGMGFIRIQKSVFTGELSWKIARKVIKYAMIFLDPKTDVVTCFHINTDDYENSISFGGFEDEYFEDIKDLNIF